MNNTHAKHLKACRPVGDAIGLQSTPVYAPVVETYEQRRDAQERQWMRFRMARELQDAYDAGVARQASAP